MTPVLRRLLACAMALAIVGSAAGDAAAAEVPLPQDVTAGDTTWTSIGDDVWVNGMALGGPEEPGLHIRDASQGPITSGYFNGAHMLEVKGALYADDDGTVDVTAGSFTSLVSTKKLKGAKVTVRYDFRGDGGRNVARALFSFKNPKSTTLRRPVRVGTALASGVNTLIEATESEDDVVDEDDSWFLSSDDGDFPAIIGGMGDTPVRLDDAPDNDEEGTDNLWIQRFGLRIKPGKTKRVLVFLEVFSEEPSISGTLVEFANAYSDGATLEEAGMLVGLTATERKQVVNWDLPPPD